MYEIKKNVKVKDFDEETKSFLLDVGLSNEDDLSSMFEGFLRKKHIDFNEPYIINNPYADNLELQKSITHKYTKDNIVSFRNKKIEGFDIKMNGKAGWMHHYYRSVSVC